jgi:hypothetical protein
MPAELCKGIRPSFRRLVSVSSVLTFFLQENTQICRQLVWTCCSRHAITLCWDPEGSLPNIFLVSYNRNTFLVRLYYIRRDFEARNYIQRASGPERSRSQEVSFIRGVTSLKRNLQWRTEIVFRVCELPETRTNNIGAVCTVYLVTLIQWNALPKLTCTTDLLGSYSDISGLWFCSSQQYAAALLENNNANVCVGRGGLLLVPEPETVTLDPTNFSLFSFRPPAMDLTTAYRYNQNMMEYYTCKSKS